jgi:hypothetical protein
VLIIFCTLLFLQGPPPQVERARDDHRMLLTKPSDTWIEWWEFMGTPPGQRRAAFERFPPEKRRRIIAEHLRQLQARKLTQPELDAIAAFQQAIDREAFADDKVSREKFWRAHEHLLKALLPAARQEMEALMPDPSRRTKRQRVFAKLSS